MLFSEREIDALRLLGWCQSILPENLKKLLSETECENLIALKLIRRHEKSGALMLAAGGALFLKTIYGDSAIPNISPSYRESILQRRLRLSRIVLTAYQGRVNPFAATMAELAESPSLFLTALTRDRGANPWGSTHRLPTSLPLLLPSDPLRIAELPPQIPSEVNVRDQLA